MFTFDFHFAAQFFACNFGIFIFSQGPSSTFFQLFLQASRVSRHTSSQGESFRSFWEAATYDKLYVIVKQSLLLLESNRNPFCRRPESHQHHRARSIRFHSSDFSLLHAKVCTAAPPVWVHCVSGILLVQVHLQQRSDLCFRLFSGRRIPMFMRSPHGSRHFPQRELRPFPSAEL